MSSNNFEIVSYLDSLLRKDEFKDFTSNGLQIEGTKDIARIGFAVDASLTTFKNLSACQMIVVHHGLFWPSIGRIAGYEKERVKFLLERDINLYVSHLPLDAHPQLGNNVQILLSLGYQPTECVDNIAWYADLPKPEPLKSVMAKVCELFGEDLRFLNYGSHHISRIFVCTGSGGQEYLTKAKEVGADLYITGEGSHPFYHYSIENRMNVVMAGHYATEVFGVKALMPYIKEAFQVQTVFYDCPTGF